MLWRRRLVALFKAVLDAVDACATCSLDAISDVTLTPTPPSWTLDPTLLFYRGSPFCTAGLPLPHAQQPFGFHDNCQSQEPKSVVVSSHAAVFALLAMAGAMSPQTLRDICALQTATSCVTSLQPSYAVATSYSNPTIQATIAVLAPLNVSLMQFAADAAGNNWPAPHPSSGGRNNVRWAFYGWVCLFEWVVGTREVVSLQGDVATLALISTTTPTALQRRRRQKRDPRRILRCGLYHGRPLCHRVCVSCLPRLCSLGCRRRQLFSFNRTVGSIWIGRPLVFLRGISAVLMLSTAQVELVTSDGHHSHFAFVPQSVVDTCVVAGVATWVAYVAVDFCLVALRRFTKVYAPLGCYLAWVILVVFELSSPVLPHVTLARHGVSQDMDGAVQCTVGLIAIGSFCRVGLIVVIQLTSLTRETSDRAHRGSTLARSGRHLLCRARAYKPATYTFDTKLWVFSDDNLSTGHIKCFDHGRGTTNQAKPCVLIAVGIGYAIGAILGSISYLELSGVNLANDLWWAYFNMTGAHAFLAGWLNEHLVLGLDNATLQLDAAKINTVQSVTGSVKSAINYGARCGGVRRRHRESAQAIEGWKSVARGDSIPRTRLTVADEVHVRQSHGITAFTTQWQNFKRVGLINTYAIVNSFGLSHAFTLQSQNGSYRFAKQTMFRMYWGLASDLVAVGLNGGHTRASSVAAPQNGTVKSPLAAAFDVFQSTVGAYGTVDLVFVGCPASLALAVREILDAIRTAMSNNTMAQTAFRAIPAPGSGLMPRTDSWVAFD
ncbi:Aste57867_13911 [Aphanomyces stellatus]|uniref:Aste57867_13911 protein n=1 Tax=Aphanomyces stellatus TaxID=120398 RepID=A0A485L021_9STRA|nr:hypothetical protein As57867_013860 [Aphanomyces stellatus]VFT90742.1 Aste57867_13911 [Aphanomyces stellatus]